MEKVSHGTNEVERHGFGLYPPSGFLTKCICTGEVKH